MPPFAGSRAPPSHRLWYSAASKWPSHEAMSPSSPIRQLSKPLMRTRCPAPPGPRDSAVDGERAAGEKKAATLAASWPDQAAV